MQDDKGRTVKAGRRSHIAAQLMTRTVGIQNWNPVYSLVRQSHKS